MAKAEVRLVPIRQSVHVDCPIEDAFRLFTESFGAWWPSSSDCEIEPWVGGRVLERTRRDEAREWGRVMAWEPPRRIEFTWEPDGRGDGSQTVDVEFTAEADGTRVTLIHTGWEFAGVEACAASFSTFAWEAMACC